MVLFENIHLGNCRSETQPALRMSPLRNPLLLVGAVAALLVHVAAMHVPVLQRVLGTEPVAPVMWGTFLALALILFVVMEAHKWAWVRRGRTPDADPPLTLQPAT
jgi:magnesium-transporting ATPase (P-type)